MVWFCAKFRKMMISKKPGPPVPPRPTASVVANSLAKSQSKTFISGTGIPMPHGRTVIYKSPTYENRKISRHDDIHLKTSSSSVIGDDAKNTSNYYVALNQVNATVSSKREATTTEMSATTTTPPPARRVSDYVSASFKNEENNIRSEVQVVNNQKLTTNLNEDIEIKMISNRLSEDMDKALPLKNGKCSADKNGIATETVHHRLEVKQKSPVAKPRQNAPSKKLLKQHNNSEQQQQHQLAIEPGENVKNHSAAHQNIIEISSTDIIDESHVNNKTIHCEDNMNEVVSSSLQLDAATTVACLSSTNSNNNKNKFNDQHNQSAKQIDIKNSNSVINEIRKRSSTDYRAVAEKLFTEITICPSNTIELTETATDPDKSYQTKLEHCIKVRTPSPPSSESQADNTINSSTSLEFEHSAEHPQQQQKRDTNEKKVTFHEKLISELASMRMENSLERGRKRCPSNCSSESSPNGTQRCRIRRADWIEVGANGKEVKLSSCQISLEDSGLEDEERLDDGSSGVGDSWDSIKDIEER